MGGVKVYKVYKDETLIVEGEKTFTGLEHPRTEADVRQSLYQEVWREVAEMLGSGRPCAIQFKEWKSTQDVVRLGTNIRLRVQIAPLHEEPQSTDIDQPPDRV